MQMNMMCARREFKDAQQRFDHMTMVINSYLEGGELFYLIYHAILWNAQETHLLLWIVL